MTYTLDGPVFIFLKIDLVNLTETRKQLRAVFLPLFLIYSTDFYDFLLDPSHMLGCKGEQTHSFPSRKSWSPGRSRKVYQKKGKETDKMYCEMGVYYRPAETPLHLYKHM